MVEITIMPKKMLTNNTSDMKLKESNTNNENNTINNSYSFQRQRSKVKVDIDMLDTISNNTSSNIKLPPSTDPSGEHHKHSPFYHRPLM